METSFVLFIFLASPLCLFNFLCHFHFIVVLLLSGGTAFIKPSYFLNLPFPLLVSYSLFLAILSQRSHFLSFCEWNPFCFSAAISRVMIASLIGWMYRDVFHTHVLFDVHMGVMILCDQLQPEFKMETWIYRHKRAIETTATITTTKQNIYG